MNETKTLRQFGLIMTAGFFVFGAGIPYLKNKMIHPLLTGIGFLFIILTLFTPHLLKKFRESWIDLGEFLGTINSTILLTIIYLTIFTGIHFIFRLIKRDRFKRKWKAYNSTYVEKTSQCQFSDPF